MSQLVEELKARAATLTARAYEIEALAPPMESMPAQARRNRRKAHLADMGARYKRLAELAEKEGL